MSRPAHDTSPRIARVLPLRRPGAEPLTGSHELTASVTNAAPGPLPSDGWGTAARSSETRDTRTVRVDARALAQMRAGRSPESAGVTRTYDVPAELLAAMKQIEKGPANQRREMLRPLGAAGSSESRPRRGAPTAAAAPDLEQPAIGSIVAGKYRVVSHLGRGGSATIALALFRSAAGVHKLVVLKCARRGTRGSAREALIEEARLTARMNHQHVVQVHDVAEHEGLPVIVMEHLDGRSLASVMTAARDLPELDRSLKLRIVARVLSGLHYAHGLCDLSGQPLHVVHRDVSPHNIVLTCDGQVKLIDFGIAQCGARACPTARRVAGKLGYMAPEQLHGAVDRRADLFAAGVVLWELMTLRRFWARATQAEVMRHLLDGDIPRRATLDADLDDVVASICRRALAPEPGGRYATAGHMQADVERALQAGPASAPDGAAGQVVRRVRASDGLARRHELQQALRELDAAGVSPGAVALGAASHVTRARRHGRGAHRAFVMVAALLALQLGDATSKHDPGTATAPEHAALARPQLDARHTQARHTQARHTEAPARVDVTRTGSTSQLPLAVADESAAPPPKEPATISQPAAGPQHTRPTHRRSTRARPSRAAPAQHRSPPVAAADELVTQLQPGIDLRRLRPTTGAVPRAKGDDR